MSTISLAVLVVGSAQAAGGPPGSQCTEDIKLINGEGCFAPCCVQDPPNSGQYTFAHQGVEMVDIRNNPSSVVSVSFPNLRSVERAVRISYNQPGAITKISFPSMVTAGALEFIGNSSLVEIEIPRLMSLNNSDSAAYLKLQSNDALKTLNAPFLDRVVASEAGNAFIEFGLNQSLEAIDLPLLRTVEALDEYSEAYVYIHGNDVVRHVTMDDLRRLSAGSQSISWIVIDEMLQLEHLSFSQLTELLPTGAADDFSELTIGHSPNLIEFVFPSLERVTVLQLSSLKGTQRAMFPRLSELQYLWVFRSCKDSESTLKMYICSEQLLDDALFDDDGICGPAGYMLHSSNPDNEAACDSSSVCQSFTPELTECKCGAVGQCLL